MWRSANEKQTIEKKSVKNIDILISEKNLVYKKTCEVADLKI